ncbi:MAG TPA: DEAD/DEAH box helicase [Gammaproteobacteria bacterium]|nr:DEAD/DEAH box helicase [Gammaproteobacteria bacterium]
MSLTDWQRQLRRDFGREQSYTLENLGHEPFFSEFRVHNPQSRSSYRVAVRGLEPGDNFCACPDHASNELGTCKHIEFVLARLLKKRGAKTAFARGWQPPFSEIYLRNEGTRAVYFRAGTDCPASVRRAAAQLFESARGGRLPESRFDRLARFLNAAAKAGHELRAYDDALNFIAGRRDAARRAAMLQAVYPRGADDRRLAKLLKAPLYPYQLDGALFAVRAGRALIGDEMGLGKTVQAIAAMELFARHCDVDRVLVVCPASLRYQWQSEIERFSGRLARVLAGGRPQRERDFAENDFCKIINFEKLQPDLDLVTAWAPQLVVVDEAQRVKNWNTIAARALKRVDSPFALVLTGTPLENKLEELISIVQFVDQHRLGPTWKLLHEHQIRDEAGRTTGYRNLDRIGASLAPIMIRRRKSEVAAQLPARSDQTVLVPMTEPQMRLHRENGDVVAQIVSRWRRTKHLSDADQRRLTCALQNMRMSCNSTYLLDGQTDHGVKADELMALLDGDAQQGKAVVFSQWTRTHDILIRRLERRGIGYVSFHGGIPAQRRPALIESFRSDPQCRIFLSSDAGASGLNLQHASVLVNMDLPWNPALLEQRIGRIHRMGQRQPVRIVNFVAKGSIEEGMLGTLAFKRALSAGILDGGATEIGLGGSRLQRFMQDVSAVTSRIVEGEVLTAAEAGALAAAPPAIDAVAPAAEPAPAGASAGEPWDAILHLGSQMAAALSASQPSVSRGAARTPRGPGPADLALRLPSPPVAQALATMLSTLADALRAVAAQESTQDAGSEHR